MAALEALASRRPLAQQAHASLATCAKTTLDLRQHMTLFLAHSLGHGMTTAWVKAVKQARVRASTAASSKASHVQDDGIFTSEPTSTAPSPAPRDTKESKRSTLASSCTFRRFAQGNEAIARAQLYDSQRARERVQQRLISKPSSSSLISDDLESDAESNVSCPTTAKASQSARRFLRTREREVQHAALLPSISTTQRHDFVDFSKLLADKVC